MPIYTIKCKACKKEEDILMTWNEKEELIKKPCPHCKKVARINKINGIGIQMSRQFRNGLA